MPVRTVFFDVDGTLVQLVHPADAMWTAALRSLGIDADAEAIAGALRGTDRDLLPRMRDYRAHRKDFWLAYTESILSSLGIADPVGQRAHAIQLLFDDERWYRVFPEAPAALHALRTAGFRLAIVSNNTDRLPRRLAALGLAQYFDDVTYSEEAGALKPDPAIFHLALRRAGCRAEEAVHAGDDYDADVLGARAAGIPPILVDREDRRSDADCPRVRSLLELGPILLDTGP